MGYLRLVIHSLDPDSGRRQGLFQAAAALEQSGALLDYQRVEYNEVRRWFADHLKKPTRFSISRKPRVKAQALSWFKASSVEHLRQLRRIQVILEDHGILVDTIQTDRPGYIVYEDAFQVAAYPFATTTS